MGEASRLWTKHGPSDERDAALKAAKETLEKYEKDNRIPDKLDRMVDAGIKAVDLYAIAREDIITRAHLRAFLKAATGG